MNEVNIEHRQHRRIELDVECFIDNGGHRLEARARNLSRSGVACLIDAQILVGATVAVDLALSFGGGERSEPLSLLGTIVWCTPMEQSFQIGVRFADLSDENAEQLDTLLHFLEGVSGDHIRR